MFLSNLYFAFIQQTNLLERIWYYVNYKLPIGNFNISLASLATGIVIFLVAITISNALQSYLQRRLTDETQIDPGIQYTLFRLAHYLILVLGGLFALRATFSLDLTSLAVLFTALSVGIGFGLQYIAGDMASGFILLFERPVRVGDFVTINTEAKGEVQGRVSSINLRTTVIITNDQLTVVVPNSKLVNQAFVNWSYTDKRTRIVIDVGVDYSSDVELVTKILKKAPQGVKFALDEPAPSVQFIKFGDTMLEFRLFVWTNVPHRHPQIRSEINYRIHKSFTEFGIKVPFTRNDVHDFSQKDEPETQLKGTTLRVSA